MLVCPFYGISDANKYNNRNMFLKSAKTIIKKKETIHYVTVASTKATKIIYLNSKKYYYFFEFLELQC